MSYPMTQDGYDNLVIELKELKTVRRPAIIKAIAVARDHGDLKENAEYHAAREEQGYTESRISVIENMIAGANVIDISKIKSREVMFGAKVTVANEETDEESTYMLVGVAEADLSKGMISNTSPIGRALLGRKKGESFEFLAPSGTKYFEVLKVSYAK